MIVAKKTRATKKTIDKVGEIIKAKVKEKIIMKGALKAGLIDIHKVSLKT